MSGAIRSVQEIIGITESGRTPDKMAYGYLVQQIDRLIRSRALDQRYNANFEIPAIIMFHPHFDRKRVAKKICSHYIKLGFECEMNDYYVFLNWVGASSRQEKCESKSKDESSSESEEDESRDKDTDDEDAVSEDEETPHEISFDLDSHETKGTSQTLSQRLSDLKKKKNSE